MRRLFAVALLAFLAGRAVAEEDPFGPMLGQSGTTAADTNSDGVRDAADLVELVKTDPAPAEKQALNDFTTKMDTLGGLSLADQRTQLQSWLAGRPDVVASGLSPDGCVWARLNTGLPVLLMTNEDPKGAPSNGASGKSFHASSAPSATLAAPKTVVPAAPPSADLLAELDDAELPTDNEALLILATGPSWPSYRWGFDFFAWFRDHEFKMPSLSSRGIAALNEYRYLPTLSVAVTQGHGGLYRDADFDAKAAPAEHLVLWTNATVGMDDLIRYRPEVKARRAVVSIGGVDVDANGDTVNGQRWAISAKWVTAYFTFTGNSVWSCQSCSGYNAEMIAAAQGKGLDVYMGWTKPIFSDFGPGVSAVTLSRTMGGPYLYLDDASPVRPLPLTEAYTEALERGNGVDDNHGGELKIARKSDSKFLQVAPSIQFMRVDIANSELVLYGQFGSDPGGANREVEMNGAPLAVKEWTKYRVAAALPTGVGDVAVKRFGCTSNKKPLIRYTGQFDVTRLYDTGERIGHMTCDVQARVDPLPYRLKPRGPLLFGLAHLEALRDSGDPRIAVYIPRLSDATDRLEVTYSDNTTKASYQYDGGWNDDSCGHYTVTGGGTLPNYAVPPLFDIPALLIPWALDPVNGSAPHYVTGVAAAGAKGTATPSNGDCDPYEDNFFADHATPGGDSNPSGSGGYQFYPAADLSIPSGTATVGNGDPSELKWTKFTPSSSPKRKDYSL